MRKILLLMALAAVLSGCDLIVNIPVLIKRSTPVNQRADLNIGSEWPVCGGSIWVVNESSVRIRVVKEGRLKHGIPFEYIVVTGYDPYGRVMGRVEESFSCNQGSGMERWVITDSMLWW